MKSEWVTLEWYECEQSIIVGGRRQIEAMRQGFDLPLHSEESSIETDIQSTGAEKAVGKLLNLDWPASINTFHEIADVGRKIEVRHSRDNPSLIVREDDPEDRAYVFVRGELPRFEIVGWAWGKEAKQPQFLKNPGGRNPAWFVPEEHLRPISELKVSKVSLGEDE